jgi:C4-dicarboxylate-specific signal transduction histidine kinase
MAAELSSDEIIALNRLTLVARLLAGTAHDVNNALQIIGGSVELLARPQASADAGRNGVARVQAQTTRAAATLDELLHFARNLDGPPRLVSLRDVAAKAAALRGFAMRRGGLTLSFDAALAPMATVHARHSELLQAVLNLIINAEQALQGLPGGSITMTLAEGSGDAVLTVRDNGRGVDHAIADRVFEPFATTRPVPDAPGLGLTAARAIARRYRGDLTLETGAPGCGATLRLPLAN